MRPTEQIYEHYTKEDFEVWNLLFHRQLSTLQHTASSEYFEALDTMHISADKIPDFREINHLLKTYTGWKLKVVPCISPQKEFFELLSQKTFTATCWLRSMEQLDYLEEPDMFHDVFGHVPLLCNTDYTNFFEGISRIALKHVDNPYAIELLGKIYWFTIEFGLIREKNTLKIYGAGIMSSSGETSFALSESSVKHAYDVKHILETGYHTDRLQEQYFVIDSFEQLYHSLPLIEEQVTLKLSEVVFNPEE